MRRFWIAAFALLGLSGCGSSSGGYRQAHAIEWNEIQTRNFTVYSSDSEEEGRELGHRMELFRAVAEFVFGRQLPPSRLPVRIFSINSRATLQAFAWSDRNLAWYSQSLRSNAFVVAGHRFGAYEPVNLLQWAYANFLLQNHGGFAYPLWYHRGFAEFMGEVDVLPDGRVEIGAIPGGRGRQRLPYMGSAWLPLRRVFSMSYGERVSIAQVTAQSWALVHYLNFGRPGKSATASLTRYFRAIEKGSSVPVAARRAFGRSIESVDRDLRSYIMKQNYQSVVMDASTFPHDASVEVRPLPEHRIAAELGELSLSHARSRERWKKGYGKHKYEQARHYFEAALAAGTPDAARIRLGIARSHLGQGDEALAESLANEVLATHPDSAEAHLVLGHVVHRRAKATADAPQRAKLARAARKHYVQSWKLDDSLPETYAAYGETFLLAGQNAAKGFSTLEHAKALLPASDEIRLVLAKLHLLAGDKPSARREALAAMYTYTGEDMDAEIKDILDATEDVEQHLDGE